MILNILFTGGRGPGEILHISFAMAESTEDKDQTEMRTGL